MSLQPSLLPEQDISLFPKVSIITVCYNSAATIESTLQSVADQDYPNIEHIIIDGLSKDDTLSIVKRFPHVSLVVSEKDKGIYDAMNKGLLNATGDVAGILNSDDFYVASDVITRIVHMMENEKADAIYADLMYVSPGNINRKTRHWTSGAFNVRKFLYGWMPPHPTFFVRKSWYEKLGGFNLELSSAADYELMLRFLYRYSLKVAYLPMVIVKMRAGGNSNASLKQRLKANREDKRAWEMNGLKPYFFTTWLKPLRKIPQFIR